MPSSRAGSTRCGLRSPSRLKLCSLCCSWIWRATSADWCTEKPNPTPDTTHMTAPTAASRHQGSWTRPASSTPMLAASAQDHGPVLSMSPPITTMPARWGAQPRSKPSIRSNRSSTSTPSPASHGSHDHPANGQSRSAAVAMTRPAAPRRVRVIRRHVRRGRGLRVAGPEDRPAARGHRAPAPRGPEPRAAPQAARTPASTAEVPGPVAGPSPIESTGPESEPSVVAGVLHGLEAGAGAELLHRRRQVVPHGPG